MKTEPNKRAATAPLQDPPAGPIHFAACGSTARMAILQALARCPEGLHVAALGALLANTSGALPLHYISASAVALEVLHALRRDGLTACERRGPGALWFAPASRQAAEIRNRARLLAPATTHTSET